MDNIAVLALFKASGVTGFGSARPLIGLLGWLLASSTMYAYYITAQAAAPGMSTVWNGILSLHLFVMGLVAVEAVFTTGFFWPLQMAIIGSATFVTFMVTALTGAAFATGASDGDEGGLSEYQTLCMTSLAVACYSNAMMLAMMFEHFHRCGRKALSNAAAKKE